MKETLLTALTNVFGEDVFIGGSTALATAHPELGLEPSDIDFYIYSSTFNTTVLLKMITRFVLEHNNLSFKLLDRDYESLSVNAFQDRYKMVGLRKVIKLEVEGVPIDLCFMKREEGCTLSNKDHLLKSMASSIHEVLLKSNFNRPFIFIKTANFSRTVAEKVIWLKEGTYADSYEIKLKERFSKLLFKIRKISCSNA